MMEDFTQAQMKWQRRKNEFKQEIDTLKAALECEALKYQELLEEYTKLIEERT